ncbi:MAG: magnesium-translocating P-type ATPase [Sarcina sp.]
MKKDTSKKQFDRKGFDRVVKHLQRNTNLSKEELCEKFATSEDGLKLEQVSKNAEKYGKNDTKEEKKVPVIVQFFKSFANAFVLVLLIIGIITYLTSIVFVPKSQQSWSQVIIIVILIFTSGIISFVQEHKSGKAADSLKKLIKTTCNVKRHDGQYEKVDMLDLVVGDIIKLTTGDIIPADLRVIECKDFFVSQSALTGESEPIEKKTYNHAEGKEAGNYENICLLGTNVVSGTAVAMVIGVGEHTYFGAMQSSMADIDEETGFEKSVKKISTMLLKFMFVMVPLVLVIDWYQTKSFLNSLLFAASVAVGLTPIMLPTIVSENLAKGAIKMSKKKTVVKKISAIQNFGSMEILCTDKTGTLTDDKIEVAAHINVNGEICDNVLKYGFINSSLQSGLQNVIDFAIMNLAKEKNFDEELKGKMNKVDEIAFDFTRRRMSIVIKDELTDRAKIITKGALEEMLLVSKYVEVDGQILEINDKILSKIRKEARDLNNEGMRVIGVSIKNDQDPNKRFGVTDEDDMILVGFIGFLDPPKESTKEALQALAHYGVDVKILTGDNELVTKKVCQQLDFKITNIVLGPEMEEMDDDKLFRVAMKTNIFAKLNPLQKARLVRVLRNGDKIVGFMGDGINDSIALKESDVGISVDTAVDIAKDAADVILLEKDLMVLKEGIIEGRKVFANTTKYLKITASSNYGNAISVLMASIFLPFVPMLPIELLIQNLVYDITQVFLPWDNVDEELIAKPRKWNAKDIGKMMIVFGPTNSIFDICTFALMWFGFGCTTIASASTFQTGWFIEGFTTQVLVLYMLRTEKIPFLQSNASWQLNASIVVSLLIGWFLPYTSFGHTIGMVKLTPYYFIFIAFVIIGYFFLTQAAKKIYIKRFGRIL